VAEFPNGLLLTHPLVNSTPNGEYALHAIQIPIPERLALIIRVACLVGQRAKVEQAIFRDTWRALYTQSVLSPSPGKPD
jgi:hypothetical protein